MMRVVQYLLAQIVVYYMDIEQYCCLEQPHGLICVILLISLLFYTPQLGHNLRLVL